MLQHATYISPVKMLLNVEKNRKNGRKNLVKKKKMSQKKFEKKKLGKKTIWVKKIG